MCPRHIQAYLGYCVTLSNYGLYPRIHHRDVSGRAVGPRWHDAVADTIHNSIDIDNVLFLEARLEALPMHVHCPRQTIVAGLPAFVYLKCMGKQWF
jgi:hypothetical protein